MKNLFKQFGHTTIALLVMLCACAPLMAQEDATPEAVPDKKTGQPVAATATVEVTEVRRFNIKDVYGNIVNGTDLEGWVMVYAFANEDTADFAVEMLNALSRKNLKAEGILYVLVGDGSKYHKLLAPFVRKELKKAYEQEMRDLYKKMDEEGIILDYRLEDRYLMVADMKAMIFKLFKINDRKDVAHLFILDGSHKVRGHYTEYSDAMSETLSAALAERDAKKEYELTTHRRSRQMWKRYALGGLLVWLAIK